MKFITVILAFLVLTLNCLPCADDIFAMNAGKAKKEFIKQHKQDKQDHSDACSPFCHCTCCAGFSINHFFAATSSLMPAAIRLYSSYFPGDLIKYSSPVWQPPKMG